MLRHFTKQVLTNRGNKIREEVVWNLVKGTRKEYHSSKKVPEFTKVSLYILYNLKYIFFLQNEVIFKIGG